MHVAGEYFRIYRWASMEKECSLLRERRPADKRRVGWRRPEVHRRDPEGKQGGGGGKRSWRQVREGFEGQDKELRLDMESALRASGEMGEKASSGRSSERGNDFGSSRIVNRSVITTSHKEKVAVI